MAAASGIHTVPITSDLPEHRGWHLDVPATEEDAVRAGWVFIGGGGRGLANAPDKLLKGATPGHLAVVIFEDSHTIAKYNGADGQPVDRYSGPAAHLSR